MNIEIRGQLKNGKPVKIPLNGKTLKVLAQPGEKYEVVDLATGKFPEKAIVKKVGTTLVIDIAGENSVIEFVDFYSNCSSQDSCSLSIDAASNAPPVIIDQSSQIGRPLSNDAFLVYENNETDHFFGWLPFGPSFNVGNIIAAAAPAVALASSGGSSRGASSAEGDETAASWMIQGAVTAGPMFQGVTVVAYDKAGKELGRASVASDGTYVITVAGQYTGPVLLKALDENAGLENYISETTGGPIDLGMELRAAAVAAGATLVVNITPLTELAARKLGVSADNILSASDADISTTNDIIGDIFGVGNILGNVVAVNTQPFNTDDGLSAEEIYGIILAGLSGADSLSDGGIATTLDLLSRYISISEGKAEIAEAGQDLIVKGIEAFTGSMAYSKIHQGKEILNSIVTISPVTGDDKIGLAEKTAGISITGTAAAHARVTVTWNGITKTAIANEAGIYATEPYTAAEIPDDTASSELRSIIVSVAGYTVTAIRNVVVDTVPPVVDSAASASFAENDTGVAYAISATDANAVSFSISGADAALFSVDSETGAVSFKMPPDFETPADANHDNVYSLNVHASDGGNVSSKDITITVTDRNDAPVAADDTGTAMEDGAPVVGDVRSNDTDQDAGDTKVVSALAGGTLGTAKAGSYGSLTLNANGSYIYAVNNSNDSVNALRTSGDTLIDTFTYTIRDTAGATSTATLSIEIQGANDAPTVADDAIGVNETATLSVDRTSGLLANATSTSPTAT